MDAKELASLEAEIAKLRAERELIGTERNKLRERARTLSAEILVLERQLPPKKKRAGIHMSVEPARVKVRPKG
jgi:chromosome segregation ATPase